MSDAAPHLLGTGECLRASDKAIYVRIATRSFWIPQSVVHDDSDVWRVGDKGKIVVAAWWAEKNGHG